MSASNYAWLIDGFTWSYSRLTTYEDCRYKFFLKYIQDTMGEDKFFAQYGSYMHLVHQMLYSGEIDEDEVVSFYLGNFTRCVFATPPSLKILDGYMSGGLTYWKNFKRTENRVVEVEKRLNWEHNGHKMVGIVDLITQDENGNYHIIDHKSKKLKPLSGKTPPTKGDLEVMEGMRQLKLYARPVTSFLGACPVDLEFNSFQLGHHIIVPHSPADEVPVYDWVTRTIEEIRVNTDWLPNPDQWKCTHICDVSASCEYCKMI